MEQLEMIKPASDCQAVALPHSAGKLPDSLLCSETPEPIMRLCMEGKEVAAPHEGGKLPLRLVSLSVSVVSTGNEVEAPHDVGRVPAGAAFILRCLPCLSASWNPPTKLVKQAS